MTDPPGGEDDKNKTIRGDIVMLSDEDDTPISTRSQESPCIHISEAGNSRSEETQHADTQTSETEKKSFNLNSDKYFFDNIYVYIESTDKNNIGRLHPMSVGHILHKKLNVKNIIEIKSIGKNRIKVQLKNTKDANSLINNTLLDKEQLRAYIPNHLLQKKAVVKGVDTRFDVEYLKENIYSSSPILEIKRTHKKNY